MIIGTQTPRIEHLPLNAVGSLGQKCVDLAAVCGLHLDPWQQYLVHQTLEVTDRTVFNPVLKKMQRKWAAFEVGVVVSRQNGKGSYLEAIELAGLFLFGHRLIIHSAHQFDTSRKAFDRILALIENYPPFAKEIKAVTRSHGAEGIILKNKQEISFRTRTKSGGRGFTSDLLVLDEAMILDAAMVGALMPTVSARPNPQIIYTGSAGEKTSTQLGRVRERAMGDKPDPRLFYAEWSINHHTDLCLSDCTIHDDRNTEESFAKANPSLNIRITTEHVFTELLSMPEEVFNRERLGVGDWPVDDEQWTVISKDAWLARHDETSGIFTDNFVIGVETDPNLKYSAIVACGGGREGRTHAEITGRGDFYDYRPGTNWLLARILEIVDEHKPLYVILDPRSQAGALVDDLDTYKVPVMTLTAMEYAVACGEFYTDVIPRSGNPANLLHLSQPGLNSAVAAAVKRDIQNAWQWDKRNSSADISPLVAATLARWGYMKIRNQKPRTPPWVARR